MNPSWRNAAQSYRTAGAMQQQHQQDTSIGLGITELEQFMVNDGPSAMELLKASGRHLIFGENREGGGFGVVYYIDGNGLHQSVEAMGMSAAYSQSKRQPNISEITVRQAVEAAVQHGNMKPAEIVSWLRRELDKIANAAPQ